MFCLLIPPFWSLFFYVKCDWWQTLRLFLINSSYCILNVNACLTAPPQSSLSPSCLNLFISPTDGRGMSTLLLLLPPVRLHDMKFTAALPVLRDSSGTCGPLLTSFVETFCLSVPRQQVESEGMGRRGRKSEGKILDLNFPPTLILWHKYFFFFCSASKPTPEII